MITATLTTVTGDTIEVRPSYDNPACSYGHPVWETEDGQAIAQIDLPSPLYRLTRMSVDDSDREVLGMALKACRLQAGLSVRAMADKAGINKMTVVRVEAGQFSPTLKLLTAIAHGVGLKLELTAQ